MVNIATIIETSGIMSSQTHHLLYELAEYDLNAFLTRPRLTLREERDSRRRGSVPKRNRSLNIQPADLIEASSNLADALDYIHNRLYNNEGRIALAHNDIKPENILVVYPDSTDPSHFFPAGRWKLTDFGLSRIKEPRKSDAELLCAEDALQPSNLTQITHRIQPSVSKTLPKRYPGSYTAPELEQNQNNPQKTDGRKADVWSFGCVLAEVIAYAVRMDERLVLELHGIAKTRFYTDGGKEIKPSIRDFFGQLPERAPEWAKESDNHTWIGSCTKLVEDILQIEPTDRLKAGDIRDRLRDIRRDPTFEKSWTDIGEENSGSPEPTSPVQSDGYFRRRGGTDEDAEQNPQIIVSPASHTTLSRNGRRSERI
jgi:serine/threonine protein kinase